MARKRGGGGRVGKNENRNRNRNQTTGIHDDGIAESGSRGGRLWRYLSHLDHDDDDHLDHDDEEWKAYLGRRVQRHVIRCLPSNYSYFSAEEELPETKKEVTTEEDVPQEEEEGQEEESNKKEDATEPTETTSSPANTKEIPPSPPSSTLQRRLKFRRVPLPPTRDPSNSNTSADQDEDLLADYARFVRSLGGGDGHPHAKHARFRFPLNWGTHVPPLFGRDDRSVLICQAGAADVQEEEDMETNAEPPQEGANDAVVVPPERRSGHVLRVPYVSGTVVAVSLWSEKSDDRSFESEGGTAYPPFEFESERQKEGEPLFRILWDGVASMTAATTETGPSHSNAPPAAGYVEDVTLSELRPCLLLPPSNESESENPTHPDRETEPPSSDRRRRRPPRQTPPPIPTPSSTRTPPLPLHRNAPLLQTHALAIRQHVSATAARRTLHLEHVIEQTILPRLVVLAALEWRREASRRVRWEMLAERRRRRERSEGKRNDHGKRGKTDAEETWGGATSLEYYAKHPNAYMSSFVPPPPLPSDDEDDEENDDEEERETNAKRPTRLTNAEYATLQERLSNECHFPPSKLAERVKAACAMACDCVEKRGGMDEYRARAAKRKEGEERAKLAGATSASGGGGGATSREPGEVRRSGRARNKVNYAEVERVVDEALRGHEAGRNGEEEEKKYVVGKEEAEADGVWPREDVSGGPTARLLLELLGWLPNSKDTQTNSNTTNENEEDENDPFFQPDRCLILDQLGRKQRYMSPADIQAAIVCAIEGNPVETPQSLLEEEQVREMETSEMRDETPRRYVTDIVCTTDDKLSDLPEFEPSSFARCRFAPRTYVPEPESTNGDDDEGEERSLTEEEKEARKAAKAAARAEAKKRREERRRIRRAAEQKRNTELEKIYRAKKAYELWRFKSIHGNGCALWPLWNERARSILKELFVNLSRVNSVEALAMQDGNTSTTEGLNGDVVAAESTHNDEALARALAEGETNSANPGNDAEPAPKRRRTRRAAGGDEPVFYGSHQSMSRDQLLSTLVRLLGQAKPGSSSIMDLKRLVFSDDFDMSRGGAVEWKKLRSALGHLLFHLGKIGRLTVDLEGDSVCWDRLKEGPLLKFDDEMFWTAPSKLPMVPSADANGEQTTVSEDAPQTPAVDPERKMQLEALENYVRRLHLTELSLRSAMMKLVDKGGETGETLLQISTVAIATGADETKGDAGAADWRYFSREETIGDDDNDSENNERSNNKISDVKWSNSGHAFIGKVIFRPSYSPLRLPDESDTNPDEKCQWYEVVSYTPSIKHVEAVNDDQPKPDVSASDTDARPNVIVQRRMRFRAVPVAPHDADAPPSESQMDIDEDDSDDIDFMVLTEAQVQAGLEAATIQRKILSNLKSRKTNGVSESPRGLRHHPFRDKVGTRVMLTPQPGDGESETFQILVGIIAGHDHSTDETNFVKDQVLILLEDAAVEVGDEKKSCSFWATVHLEGTLLTDIRPDSMEHAPSFCSRYKIDMHEYFQGSEAYDVCDSIISYLRSHPKSGPFMQPVDPIALGIPDYFQVIKNPMDISTLAKNLEAGKYSRIPPKSPDDVGEENDYDDHPVYKMAYGPFYDDLMLIFDNAVTYNTADSWIGSDALLLKKNTIRKIENVVTKATWNGQEKSKTATSSTAKKSIYADEDSDVDMYEYDSDQGDYDDDFGGGRKKSKKSKGGVKSSSKPRKEDFCSKAIERPFMMPVTTSEFGMSGAFPHLKIQSNMEKFTLSPNWACRYLKPDSGADEDKGNDEQAVDPAEDEMLLVMKLQQEESYSVRRSSRARTATKAYTDDEDPSSMNATQSHSTSLIAGVEYYLVNDKIFESKEGQVNEEWSSMPKSCRTRTGVEGIQETIHERFYAKLYREITSSNPMILENGLGSYADGSFPPYLGRVIPEFSSKPNSEEPIIWEIREQFMIPALRWILRGLVKSGHLDDVDNSLSASAANDAPTSSGSTAFGAGVVVPNHEYYYNERFQPFEVLDEKEILRKRRIETTAEEGSSSEDEVEMSAYEKMRAERVARNAERLKALGLG